jgi:hypothetical protein
MSCVVRVPLNNQSERSGEVKATPYVDAEAGQLVLEVLGRLVAAVGEKEELLALLLQPRDHLLGAGNQLVLVVHHAVLP